MKAIYSALVAMLLFICTAHHTHRAEHNRTQEDSNNNDGGFHFGPVPEDKSNHQQK